ncbi:alkyl sulfatase C-terminal domain-containing protein [Rhodococcus sp. NPDC058505]|uniref:alkyl sulfatase C-terminal domain-containing protein n=1 Tax=Rhodococcus sp. NPDC058505 TaxID=3346531 RepID=UPI00365ABF72
MDTTSKRASEGQFGTPAVAASADVISALTPQMLFDAIAIQVDGPKAWDERFTLDVVLSDDDERYRLRIANGVLTYSGRPQKGEADATVTATRRSLPALALGGLSAQGLADAGIELSGDASVLERLAAVLDPGEPDFAISHGLTEGECGWSGAGVRVDR